MPTPTGQPTSTATVAIQGVDSSGNLHNVETDANGAVNVTGGAANLPVIDASVGTVGAAVPTFATEVGGKDNLGNLKALNLDASGNLLCSVTGAGSGGTSSSFNVAFPAAGTAAGASDGTNMKPLLVDGSGFLKVNVAAGGGAGGTSSNFAAANPAAGTAAGFSDGTNMQEARVFDADTGAGTQYVLGVNLRKSASGGSTELVGQGTMANSVPVAIASDQSGVPVTGTFWQATQPVSVATLPALAAGAANIGGVELIDSGGANKASISAAGAVKVDGSAVTQPVQSVGNGAVLSNQQAVTATAAALASNACRKMSVKALAGNTISVYIGPSGVTTATGYELAPGESMELDVSNTNLVFVIASTTGASVCWVATN